MRVVIDSNVWISALVFGGKPRQVIELMGENGDVIIISEEILSEVRRNLNQKFAEFIDDFEALLIALGDRIQKVKLGQFDIKVSRDPDDNKVLETAKIGKSIAIVSGDKDLLSLKRFEFKPILQPAEFLKKYKELKETAEVLRVGAELLEKHKDALKNLADR